jgi:hypothetical protein
VRDVEAQEDGARGEEERPGCAGEDGVREEDGFALGGGGYGGG